MSSKEVFYCKESYAIADIMTYTLAWKVEGSVAQIFTLASCQHHST